MISSKKVIEVAELTSELESGYEGLILSNERSMVYGTLEFRGFLQQILGGKQKYLVAIEDSSIVGALPCFEAENAKIGRVINSLPWYGSHGGCLLSPGSGPAVRQALLARYREEMHAPDVAFGTLILTPEENQYLDNYVQILGPDVTDDRIGQITELPFDGPDLEARLERAYSQKTRNLVRKARKQGFDLVIAEDDSAWRFLHETHLENMTGIGGQAKPWSHFSAMRKAFPPTWQHLLIAKLDGVPAAAMLLLLFNRTVEYITPVIKHEYRSLQPLSFLIWHGMLHAVRRGFKWWNWGGTWPTQKSLHHFKAGWGAQDFPYTYLIHAKPDALDALRRDRKAVARVFPYYFTYPFHLLGQSHA